MSRNSRRNKEHPDREWERTLQELEEEERLRRRRYVQPAPITEEEIESRVYPREMGEPDPIIPLIEMGAGCRDCELRHYPLRTIWAAASRLQNPVAAFVVAWRSGLDVYAEDILSEPLTQAEVADRINKSQGWVSRTEATVRRLLRWDPEGVAKRIVESFDLRGDRGRCLPCEDRAALGAWLGALAGEIGWPPVVVGSLRLGYAPWLGGGAIDLALRQERTYIAGGAGWPESRARHWERAFWEEAARQLDNLNASPVMKAVLADLLLSE